MNNNSDPDTESFTKSCEGQSLSLAWQVRHNTALPAVCKQGGTLNTEGLGQGRKSSGPSHVFPSSVSIVAFFLSLSPHTTDAPHLNSELDAAHHGEA